ncbi:hypothetical protein CRU87_04115 [Aliarcobacter trophiarum LMG 25534]|uniref:Transglutaminase-like cysteine proteinase, C93 family n=1 Tax=Aliarcobacter trophiarum LMG 25534 TaxID=1032241 RepID=A0AAD0VNC6_9BACT|nr:transglutaminase-like cysteine peptidase [Aliarcobacter trophiarum]AXK49620.1 putative transglutaminase-like cysteine proteinase, C93 family [Aliarcobacter trophiarum LMG 25534]RXJ92291.1 hypothetical protein CRU87_04115 [Aliarcobacter trophiarum LMG 25534]
MKKIYLIISILFINSFAYELKLNSYDINTIESSKQKSAIYKRVEKYKEFRAKTKNLTLNEKLDRVNFFINRTLPELDNFSIGIDDYWMTPKEFLIKGRGDCEDYAIAKYFTLLELGVKKENLYMAVVKERTSSGMHMVLFYIEDKNKSPLVLDNLSFKVLPLSKRVDLLPNVAFNEIDAYQFSSDKFTNKVVIDWQNDNKWDRLLNRVYKQKH